MNLLMNQVQPQKISKKTDQASGVWNSRLALKEGNRYFCHAPSGTGKSTFIHLLYGLRNDYEGEIYWGDQLIATAGEARWAEWRSQKLSIVFQDLRLFPELSLWDNICIKQSLTTSIPLARAKEWLEALGLLPKLRQDAGTLSYGEQQRVAIVRALMQPFRWLLLDEPFSHLDDRNIQIAVEIINGQLRKQKAGLILADVKNHSWLEVDQQLIL